jgi:hypothetical protein
VQATGVPMAPAAARIRLDALGRVTSDAIEAAGGLGPAMFAPRPGQPRRAATPRRPGPAPGEPGNPARRSVAERAARYAIANRAGRLTGPQLARLARDWDTGPRDGETPAAAVARARADLQRLAALAWAEHVKAAGAAASQ